MNPETNDEEHEKIEEQPIASNETKENDGNRKNEPTSTSKSSPHEKVCTCKK